jgi:Coenzyme PQQ synthesis protein D (PqqD)
VTTVAQELRLRPDGLSWREVDGELVAVDVESSTYLGANPSGMILWQALAQGATREELVARLVEEFGIASERAATDVDAFLEALDARGLLERTERE